MTVYVKLFAVLRQQYPHLGIGEKMAVELSDGATAGRLLELLNLPSHLVKVVFVNGIIRDRDYVLQDGDEVGIFPPVGGG
ncbi:MAG: MoaD/ThiS family protein [Anaerolineae bacterium]|nr:MoaD/ThiS family protein [Anaerolineae bacterium]